MNDFNIDEFHDNLIKGKVTIDQINQYKNLMNYNKKILSLQKETDEYYKDEKDSDTKERLFAYMMNNSWNSIFTNFPPSSDEIDALFFLNKSIVTINSLNSKLIIKQLNNTYKDFINEE